MLCIDWNLEGNRNCSTDACALMYARCSLSYERHMKRKLVVAVDHFNKDHKKGLQFLQVRETVYCY